MPPSHQLSIPPGFTSATVAGRRLRHLVPPAGRYGVCGAPIASDTLVPALDAVHRVCPHCVDRVEGRKSPVPQRPARAAPPAPAPAVAKPRVTVELSAAAAELLDGTLDAVSRRGDGRGRLVTFVVPLDGSVLSRQAIPYARAIAEPVAARLVFVRGEPSVSWSYEAGGANRAELEKMREALAHLAHQAREQGALVEWEVVDDEATSAILGAVERHHADIIVMSTHGRTGVGRFLFGSVADRVLRRTSVPVLLIPSSASPGFDHVGGAPFHLLVPLDGSPLAEAALAPAAELASTLHAHVTLLRSVDPASAVLLGAMEASKHYDPIAELASARKYLEGCMVRFPGGTTVATYVAEGPPAEVILAAARTSQAHAVVMATHGRGPLSRAVLGSVAEAVVHGSRLPTLLVRPDREAASTEA